MKRLSLCSCLIGFSCVSLSAQSILNRVPLRLDSAQTAEESNAEALSEPLLLPRRLPAELALPADQLALQSGLRESQAKLNQGQLDEALSQLRKLAESWAEHPSLRITLADTLLSAKQYQEAESLYLGLLEEFPNHFQALNNCAWLYSTATDPEMFKPEEALKLARQALMVAPLQQHHVWSTLSQALFVNEEYDEALRCARMAQNLAEQGKAGARVIVGYLFQAEKCAAALDARKIIE